jgi:hypothetical protein
MNIEDLKLTFLNTGAFLISFSNIENVLKILLLTVSIVYTTLKIIEMRKAKKDETNKKF